jgi:manganese oxidase
MMNRGRLARSAMSLLLVGCVLLSVNALGQRHPASSDGSLGLPPAPRIVNNDNTRPAGRLEGEVLAVRMVAELGSWQPEGPRGATLKIAAFGEDGGKLSVPGPLLRVREGATIAVTLRNALPADLRVAGFCSRPGKCDAVTVPAGAKREFRFGADAPGTYFYWASTASSTLPKRSRFEGQLGGALVVDARDAVSADRVFVISSYDDPLPIASDPRMPLPSSRAAGEPPIFAINGASWPHTETLTYRAHETIRWRVVNLSNIGHAMHLHGFHFALEATGDGAVDRPFALEQRRTEVTEVVGVGRTFAMSWTPTRPGNWLFHCHMTEHMAASGVAAHEQHGNEHAAGMAGLVLGIRVTGPPGASVATSPRQLRMVLREDANRYGRLPGYRVDIEGGDAPRLDPGPVPGPVLVLQRGEPVAIEVVNRLSEPSAIHWHGMELESYFDGVPGYSGQGEQVAPAIAPGASFTARFTPPRAGTFIYHTHWHDDAQLAGGIYGALVVLEPGQRFDPAVDHVIIIGLNGVLVDGQREPFALNGRELPAPILMRMGVPNRIRLINITANNSILTAFLMDRFEPATWNPIAKDGAALPADRARPREARQLVSVGETYDFEVVPTPAQNLWIEVRRGNGEWVLQAPVVLR